MSTFLSDAENVLRECAIQEMNTIPSDSSRYEVATISRLPKNIGLFANEPYKTDYILQKRSIF